MFSKKCMSLVWHGKLSSAHYVKGHPTCGKTHGHTYQVIVRLQGLPDPETGMLMDFGDIRRAVKRFDHVHLNELAEFPEDQATLEYLPQARPRPHP